jgi:Papain family cysteine protease
MEYSVSNSFGGLANLKDYPFADADGTTTTQCELAGKNLSVEVYQPTIVVAYNDQDSFDDRVSIFQSAVAQQPVSISMDSNCTTFQNYAGGVMTDDGGCACVDTSCIDHSVLLVGYNNTNSPPYWYIKNSWVSKQQ